eukprot:gene5039-10096_t
MIFTVVLEILLSISYTCALLSSNYSIGFLHMRKAGGTLILDTMGKWMRTHGCFSDPHENVKVQGIRNGISLQPYPKMKITFPTLCPYVNIIHEEFGCLNAVRFLQILPRHERKHLNITFFTTLRDPIERIVSQAFNGKKDIGFATLNSTEAIELLKTNEKIWLGWMGRNIFGFGDQYMPNYYVKRLAGVGLKLDPPETFQAGLNCISHPEKCQHESSYDILRKIFRGYRKLPSIHELPISDENIQLSKEVLRTQFEFIIMEQFSTNRTRNAIRSAFFGTYDFFNPLHLQRKNSGIGTLLGLHSYSSLVPPVVLKKLREENAGDIELYDYALKLFDQRAIEEGWDREGSGI